MRGRLGWGAVVTGLVAAALTTVAPASTAVDPAYQAPVVGQCNDLSSEELAAPSYAEAPVDCATAHTSVVIAVAQLPDGLAYDDGALQRFALETCFPAQRKVLGTSRLGMRLTAYNIGYFIPTPEQQAAGARWLRCDLVLGNAADLQPLPAKLDVGRFPFRASVSRCLAGRDFHLTVCSRSHTFRATAAIRIDARRFPSERAWQRIGTERCRTAVSSRTYRFGWPSKVAWQAGDRALVCYTRTRR
jgi:hypothetical protein